jgi:hypothetical protein
MHLSTMTDYDALRERYAERWALNVSRSATFIQCLEKFDVAPTITVNTPKGKSIVINASDIYAARKKFFAKQDSEHDLRHMTLVGDRLVDLYEHWLLNEHTERYHYVLSDVHRKWLRRVIILMMARHLMEQKFALYEAQGSQTFVDDWACGEMVRLQLLNSLTSELARLVHHIVRDPGQKQELIDLFHTDLDVRVRELQLSKPEPLPPLPPGEILPFALPSQGKETPSE